jgi:hypothetical protein
MLQLQQRQRRRHKGLHGQSARWTRRRASARPLLRITAARENLDRGNDSPPNAPCIASNTRLSGVAADNGHRNLVCYRATAATSKPNTTKWSPRPENAGAKLPPTEQLSHLFRCCGPARRPAICQTRGKEGFGINSKVLEKLLAQQLVADSRLLVAYFNLVVHVHSTLAYVGAWRAAWYCTVCTSLTLSSSSEGPPRIMCRSSPSPAEAWHMSFVSAKSCRIALCRVESELGNRSCRATRNKTQVRGSIATTGACLKAKFATARQEICTSTCGVDGSFCDPEGISSREATLSCSVAGMLMICGG